MGNGTVPSVAQRGPRCNFLAGAPAVLDKIVGDAAGNVCPVIPDIAFAVAGCIDRVGPKTRWHELRAPHCAGVRAQRFRGVDFFLACEDQELLQFVAEKPGARRVIEREGCERVDDPVSASDTPVVGLDADDADDHFNRYTGFRLNALEHLAIFEPEPGPRANALPGHEDLAVLGPRQFLFRGRRNLLDDCLLDLGFAQQRGERIAFEVVISDHLVDKSRNIGPGDVDIDFVGGLGTGNGNGKDCSDCK